LVLAQPPHEPFGAPEAAHAYLAGRQPGRGHPAGQGVRHARSGQDTGVFGRQKLGEATGLGRAAQDQYVHEVRFPSEE
jgi:hypothetical protein